MIMSVAVVSIAVVAINCVLARRAERRFRDQARLPMQWGITGAVIWSAPRRLALAFMPGLSTIAFGSLALLSPRAGQEGLVLPTLAGMGAMLVAVQCLHLWLIDRTIRRRPR